MSGRTYGRWELIPVSDNETLVADVAETLDIEAGLADAFKRAGLEARDE